MESFLLDHLEFVFPAFFGMWLAFLTLLAVGLPLLLRRPAAKWRLGVILLASSSFTLILAVWLTAVLVKARTHSARAACIANLQQINGAKATWAIEQKKIGTDIPTDADLFGPTNYIRAKPICPSGGLYILGPISEWPTCSLGMTNAEHTLEPRATRLP